MKKICATLGFVFTPDFQQVLLIRKRRPNWQAGKINGVGGKTEPGESPRACISREMQEESGLVISPELWQKITVLRWDVWEVEVFASVYVGKQTDVVTLTDEEVTWFPATALPAEVMSNLRWLIPLSVDVLTNPTPPVVAAVEYPPEN